VRLAGITEARLVSLSARSDFVCRGADVHDWKIYSPAGQFAGERREYMRSIGGISVKRFY
jgi:hypothetical protein